jgi:hypothetical protein
MEYTDLGIDKKQIRDNTNTFQLFSGVTQVQLFSGVTQFQLFSGVTQFHQHFIARICTKVLYAAFLLLQFGFLIFWQKNIGEKAACKNVEEIDTCSDAILHPIKSVTWYSYVSQLHTLR